MTFTFEYAHWHQFFENLSVSSAAFYKTLQEGLRERQVPQTTISQVDFLEGSLLSDKRVYLQVRRDWMTYHICVAPFGTGFFVSSRLIFSPWNSWPVMAVIAAIMCLGVFMVALGTGIIARNMAVGLILSFMAAFPAALVFGLVFIVWIILCLRMTYYRQDTMAAFHDAVHRLLISQINAVVEASGRKPLTDEESKPVMHRLLRRGG